MLPPPGSGAAGRCEPRPPRPACAGYSGGSWRTQGGDGLPSSGVEGCRGLAGEKREVRADAGWAACVSLAGGQGRGGGRGTPSPDLSTGRRSESGAFLLFSAPFLPT